MPQQFSILTWDNLGRDELDRERLEDLEVAGEARLNAQAQYSKFLVGAAIRTKDGKVFPGWNVEYVVYDALHAEENALGRITPVSLEAGLRRITVVGSPEGLESEEPVSPCGSCRQKLLEFLRSIDDPEVIMAGVRGRIVKIRLRDLLAFGFFPEVLKK